MNKGVLIAIVLAVLVALGGGAFYLMNKNNSADTQTSMQTENSTQTSLDKKSLRDLMGMSNNQQCTFTDSESNSSGMVYVSGGKVRGDFDTSSDTGEIKAHMIATGDEVYVWMDGSTDGFKTTVTATESVTSQMQNSIDINKAIDYDCSNWSPNNSLFQVPSNVTFKDYSSLMMQNETSTQGADTKTIQCNACNSLPAEAAAQCKTALGCN